MQTWLKLILNNAALAHSPPHKPPGQETGEEEGGLELPVNPDQGTPLVPNEEGVVTVPA
ncbi:MAG: hypothetical protein JWR68_2696 [Polaromonas sp.]|nr:hypothetical protein [Polaromonas sp.]